MNISRLAHRVKSGGALCRLITPGKATGLVAGKPGRTKARQAVPTLFLTLAAVIGGSTPVDAAPVRLAWNANLETNITTYKVKYGTATGVYTAGTLNAGTATTASVSGLTEGTTYYFTITATNAAGTESPAASEISYLVPRTGANQAPVATSQSVTTAEDTAMPILLSGTDADGNALTYTVVGNPSFGMLTGTPPNLSYKGNSNYYGNDSFTFLVNDGTVNSATATVNLTITPVNDPPFADAKAVATPKNTPMAIVLTGGDYENDPRTFSIYSQPSHGTLTGTPPNVIYTPAFGYTGGDSFVFRSHDGLNYSNVATISVTVTPANSAPTAVAKSLTTKEDIAMAIVLTGTDDDGDTLTYTVLSQPAKGGLSGTAPNLTYTPSANLNGSDSFTFRVNDGTVNSATATVSITITPVNDPPFADPKSVSTPKNTPVAIVLTGGDYENDPRTFSVISQPGHGTLSGAAPNVTYIPATGYTGSDSFTFRTHDGQDYSTIATVSISVSPSNEAPVALAKSVTTLEDTAIAILLSATDGDGDNLTYTVVSQPAKGILTGTAPSLTYTPTADANGSDSFTFRVNDGTVNSATATVTITITPVNDAPVALAKSLTTQEDVPVAILLVGTDKDGDALTYTVVNNPTRGVLTGTAPNLTYTPYSNFNGNDSFTFEVADATTSSTPVTVAISVSPVNDAPVVTGRSVSTTENLPVTITLAGSDVDGDPISLSVVSNPAHGTLKGTMPNLTYTPTTGYYGSDSFTYRANDGTVNSATATVTITVAKKSPAEASLIARAGWTLKYVDSQETYDSPATAAFDGDPATFWHTQWRSGATATMPHEIQINLGAVQDVCGFLYLPRQDGYSVGGVKDYEFYVSTDGVNWGEPVANGTFHSDKSEKQVLFTTKSGQYIRFRVLSEIYGNNDTCVAELNVLKGGNVNRAPVATAQTLTTEAVTPLAVTLAGTDPDGSPLVFSIESSPAHGTLSGTAPNLTYLPDAGFSGSDSFTFRANDGAVFSTTATIAITVTPVTEVPGNVAPVFSENPITGSATQDEAFAGQLIATDANVGDVLTFRKISGPSWLTVAANGELGGTPGNANVGTNTFTVKVNDPSNASSTATLSIRVANVNDAPVFKISPLIYPAGTEKMIYRDQTLAATAYDPDGEGIAYSKVSGPGWLTVSRTGTLDGTPPAGSAGTNTFVIRVTDAAGATANTNLQIWINANTLPLPWNLDRVGMGNKAGAARYSAGIFTVAGAGALTPTADAGNFGWQMVGKKGQITARVRKLHDTGDATRVGVMIRASLAANSRQVFLGVDGDGDYQFLRRTKNAGKTAKASKRNKNSDHIWIRLVRDNEKVTAYTSDNGTKWVKVGSCSVDLPSQSYIGLSVSSGDKDKLNTSKFSNVKVTE